MLETTFFPPIFLYISVLYSILQQLLQRALDHKTFFKAMQTRMKKPTRNYTFLLCIVTD